MPVTHSESIPPSNGPEGLRILVVEDDAVTQMLLKSMLQRHGHRVIQCLDGEAALRASAEEEIDAVVLDLMLPKVDGMQVLKELRNRAATMLTPVIILSTVQLKVAQDEARQLGARRYLDKREHRQLLEELRQIAQERTAVGQTKLKMATPSGKR